VVVEEPFEKAEVPKSLFDAQYGPGHKILGKIDLRQLEPEIPKVEKQAETSPAVPTNGQAVPSAGEGEPKPFKKKKRKIVKKPDLLELREHDLRRGRIPRKKKALPGKEQKKTEITVPKAIKRIIRVSEGITVAEMAKSMAVKAGELIKKIMDLGMMATINQVLDTDVATLVASEFGYQIENVAFDAEGALQTDHFQGDTMTLLVKRPPVVAVMGHVDHGKTSLLDAIRKTNVTAGEAGGITQHIGAYSVEVEGGRITFLDTPGHEAFTAMRARGAKVTDLVVLVTASDEGVMPQTIEAIDHARAADVPLLVCVNKIDKPEANMDRIKKQLAERGVLVEEWGGQTVCVPVSAKTHEGIPHLLEMILLQAELLDLRANPDKLARGTIIEAKLDKGRGPVATVLVQEGTLKVGNPFVCGIHSGRVRAMIDDKGRKTDEAGASTPVEILGFEGVPEAGESFVAVTDEAKGRQIAQHRGEKLRQAGLATKSSRVSLEELNEQIRGGEVKELRVVLKTDVHGSLEAMQEALSRFPSGEVRLKIIHGSVGGITESDVLLAAASNAIVLGFNVRPEGKGAALAEREGIEIRLYTVIYDVVGDIRKALEGLLEPSYREQVMGRLEIRKIFTIGGIGTVAGCYVTEGKILRNLAARLVRDHVVVHQGKLGSLKRFKDDVREVSAGYECGASIEGYPDIKAGDVIECYEMVPVIRKLEQERASGSLGRR
jgi:translation initiation factor IF-2